MMIFALSVVLLLIQTVNSTIQPSLKNLNPNVVLDYDVFDAPTETDLSLYSRHLEGYYNSTGRPYSAYLATFPVSRFSFHPPLENGCTNLIKTSDSSSKVYDCEYATNGAFFTWDMPDTGTLCIGNLISDGDIWQTPTDGTGTSRANFGVTKDGTIVTGFIDSNVINNFDFTQLITGWGWLVRKGINYVNSSQDLTYEENGFTYEKAPRTSVGFFKNGSMVLLEIDGEEDIYYGPDLFETAELLVSIGVYSAINIDGGGSSVSVKNGNVISQPTCLDTPEICERAVASITCVKAI